MLFSGRYVAKKCSDCDYEFARSTPTSIIAYLVLPPAIGFGAIGPTLETISLGWWLIPVILILEFALFIGILAILSSLRTKLMPIPTVCPKCSTDLENSFSGFYDFGCLPTLIEVATLVLFGALNFFSLLWLEGRILGG